MPPRKILIRGARQLLTLRGVPAPRRVNSMSDLAVVPDGAVLIEDERIVTVGPGRRIENLAEARGAEVIDADGCVVMPGFVDPHTMLVSGPSRVDEFEMHTLGASLEQSGLLREGVQAQVRNVRNLPARRLELQAKNTLLRCLRHGTTTIEAKTGYGLDDTGEMKCVRVLEDLQACPISVLPTWFGARALPAEYAGNAEGYLRFLMDEMLPRIARRKTIAHIDADPAACSFSLHQTVQLLRTARLAGFMPRLHAALHQPDSNVELAVAMRAESVSHCNFITDDQIGHLCDSSTVAVLLPGLAYHLRLNRLAPARRLIDGGAAMAVASGYDPLYSPTCNMQMIISLACNQLHMSPAEAIQAATFNAACAAGVARETGSLEAGKFADLLILSVPDYREIPYHFGMNLVSTVIRRGTIVHQETAPEWRVA